MPMDNQILGKNNGCNEKQTNKHWHIPLTPFSNHLNGEI